MQEPVAPQSFTVSEVEQRAYVRSPITAIRLVGVLIASGLLLIPVYASADADFATRFSELLDGIPRWIVTIVVSACQLAFIVPSLLGFLGQVALRRFARVGRMLLAAVLAALGLLAVRRLVGADVFPLLPARGPRSGAGLGLGPQLGAGLGGGLGRVGYGIGASFPTNLDLGVIAAWFFVDRDSWSTRWRRAAWVVLLCGMIARLGVAFADPATILLAITIGAAAARLVHVVLGTPNTRPRARKVGSILEQLGYDLRSVEAFDGFRGFAGFVANRADGERLFVKIVSRDSWASLLPVRLYRFARFRDVGDDRPFRSLHHGVEHEALCALKAFSDGVPTARLAVVTEFPPDAMMMAFDSHPFVPLSALPPERHSPDLATSVWRIVDRLQRSHTVHHRLNADALMVDEHGEVIVVEFTSARLGVVDSTLATDVAEVLAATAAHLGVEPAVDAAVKGVGRDAVVAALPRLQPLALTPLTRTALKHADCLETLRSEVERVTGAEPVPIAELERVKPRWLATVAMVMIALWTLVPQIIGTGSVWATLLEANWWWAAAALGLSAVTYFGAAIALDGATPERLPLAPNMGVQVATSFVGVAAPGGALALTARFLQKRGVEPAAAAAAVGVNTVAGVAVHLTLTALFVLFAGSSGLATFALPSAGTIAIVVAGIAAVALSGFVVPRPRSLLVGRGLPATKRSFHGVSEIAHQPSKLTSLFGGSFLITAGYILALEVSVMAFGAGPSFTSVAIVYLLGSVISSVAPTPGGIGAVEATLIAGLTSAGLASATAVGAVLLFRVTTFWLPLLPGWATFTAMQRSGDL